MIELGMIAAASVVIVVVGLYSARRQQRAAARSLETWMEALRQAGAQDVGGRIHQWDTTAAVQGEKGDLLIDLRAFGRDEGPSGLAIEVFPLGAAAHFSLLPVTEPPPRKRGTVLTHDDEFDDRFVIKGSEMFARAALGTAARRALTDLARPAQLRAYSDARVEARVEGGRLHVHAFGLADAPEALPGLLEYALDAGQALAARVEPARALAANATGDRHAAVRAACLATLRRDLPADPAAREALLAARSDPSPEVRLQAGLGLGAPEGDATLIELAQDPADEVAAAAIGALGLRLPVTDALAILERALARARARTARECLDALLLSPLPPEAEALAATALRAADEEVQEAAVRALGRGGSAAAVPALRLFAGQAGRGLAAAANQAVLQIKARLPGATPGQLSLAPGTGGQLSVSDSRSGQVTLDDDERPT